MSPILTIRTIRIRTPLRTRILPSPRSITRSKVNYVINRYVVPATAKRVLVSSHYYKSYVGNTIYADALYSGQTPGTTGTTNGMHSTRPSWATPTAIACWVRQLTGQRLTPTG